MHTIQPAGLKPGATLPRVGESTTEAAVTRPSSLIRGHALVFWDRKSPAPKKLDAIDTDQITPAADCVSESLETLDERWKAGSFRYLMPDFARACTPARRSSLPATDLRSARRGR